MNSNTPKNSPTILVLAHAPPPFHGQSLIVKEIVDYFTDNSSQKTSASDAVKIIHLNIQFSHAIIDIGRLDASKVFLLLKFALQLLKTLIFHRPQAVYYVPAPGKRVAIYRDFVLLSLVMAFRVPRIFHWLAGGLQEWLQTSASFLEKKVLPVVYKGAALSVVPVSSERANALGFSPKSLEVFPTGISDPCPDCRSVIIPSRIERLRTRKNFISQKNPALCKVIFMGHCTAEKGLFVAIEAVARANREMLRDKCSMRFALQVFGAFPDPLEKEKFDGILLSSEWRDDSVGALLEYRDFVSGQAKYDVFAGADILCFPSYYFAEVIPTVILDALAFALPVVTTEWRGIPELLPKNSIPPSPIKNITAIVESLVLAADFSRFEEY